MPSGSVTGSSVLRLTVVTTVVSASVVILGGTAVWQLEGGRPGSMFGSWKDGVWWAMSTLTTVGYGDYVPETTTGRVIAGLIMVTGVAVLGAVAAVVALIFATGVARREERILEAEGRTLELRLEARLDALDARLAGIEEHLRRRSFDDDTRGNGGRR
jgi:voltage-gated potassium channel